MNKNGTETPTSALGHSTYNLAIMPNSNDLSIAALLAWCACAVSPMCKFCHACAKTCTSTLVSTEPAKVVDYSTTEPQSSAFAQWTSLMPCRPQTFLSRSTRIELGSTASEEGRRRL